VIFSKPNSSIPTPPEFMQHLVSARLQGIAQMNRMVAARPIPMDWLCIDVAKSVIARVRRGMAPVPRVPDKAHSRPDGCRSHRAREP
jgi:hypothetical protein